MNYEPNARVLLVEDDPRLAELIADYLGSNGFAVAIEPRGDAAVRRITEDNPDVVILDLMLPGLDGLGVCRAVRPVYPGGILMLTARGDEVDEVVGLELGADDYLAKPVRPRLLLARLHALLRRLRLDPTEEGPGAVRADGDRPRRIELGGLVVDMSTREARLYGEALDLTTSELDLLWLLASHAGEVVSRDTIYEELRGIPYDGADRSMDLRVARLRRKLGDDAASPRWLKSVRGVGYLLVGEGAP